MTPTKKCLIEISDIIGMQYECNSCHAAIVVPIDKIRSARETGNMVLGGCSYCGTPWGFQSGSQEARIFGEFNELLSQVANIMEGRNMKLRLDIKCPE